MKKLLTVTVLVCLIIGAFSVHVYAEERENVLSVSGSYTVVAVADEAYVTVGVKTGNINYQLCQDENKNKMNNVMNAIKELGIEERYIKTIEYNSIPVYEYEKTDVYTGIYYNGDYYNKRILKEYQLTHKIRVTLTDVSLVGKLIDITVANGINELNNVEFSISKPKQHQLYLEALDGASKRAKDKAEVLAKAFDIKTLKIKSISAGDYNPYVSYSYNSYVGAPSAVKYDEGTTQITSGEIQISATVNIEYTY